MKIHDNDDVFEILSCKAFKRVTMFIALMYYTYMVKFSDLYTQLTLLPWLVNFVRPTKIH